MSKYRIWAIILIVILLAVGYFDYASQIKKTGFVSRFPFRLGLDLAGGTQLTYKADVSKIDQSAIGDSMSTLRDVIERRVNLFGVSEPVVQVEGASVIGGTTDNKLIVELPGVTDIQQAVDLIGKTPVLEFKLLKVSQQELATVASTTPIASLFTPTELTGRFLQKAQLEFNQTTNEPIVTLIFNAEGKALFAKITKENVGKVLAIFLDNQPISMPVIREEIKEGKAQISGGFTAPEAQTLVRNLNYGALPLPIELVSTQTVGPSLGQDALFSGIRAGLWGLALVALFLIIWYRLPGVIATVSLIMYVALTIAVFKLIPVTLTAAGIAGFILSIGMAVDANILIFERMKEEFRSGRSIEEGMREGFKRAWLSIRDSNISSLITAAVLFWVGTSSVRGFALTLGLGVLISMFTAITASRTFLLALHPEQAGRITNFLFHRKETNINK
ncbi:protein translocase subunit SecD [Candidatus Parcubacteria bacterium]|nr:protein translocase subunit SecD [Candidatus Parcubacteria bacterium]